MGALIASLVALLLGPPVAVLGRRSDFAKVTIDTFVLVTLGGLVLLEILPHAYHLAGMVVVIAAVGGLALSGALHHKFEHGSRGETLSVFGAAGIALAVHAVLDGIALAGHRHESGSGFLTAAVVLHRVPMGLAIWWLARPALGAVAAGAALVMVAASTVVGFFVGPALWSASPGPVLGTFQALVAGTLLHVAYSHRPRITDAKRPATPLALGVVLGLALFAAMTLGGAWAQDLLH